MSREEKKQRAIGPAPTTMLVAAARISLHVLGALGLTPVAAQGTSASLNSSSQGAVDNARLFCRDDVAWDECLGFPGDVPL